MYLRIIKEYFYLEIISFLSLSVSLRRHADGISFGEAMEKVIWLGALSPENIALYQNQILANDIEWYWKF